MRRCRQIYFASHHLRNEVCCVDCIHVDNAVERVIRPRVCKQYFDRGAVVRNLLVNLRFGLKVELVVTFQAGCQHQNAKALDMVQLREAFVIQQNSSM